MRNWWQCPVLQCVKFHGGEGFWNHGGRDQCMACHQPKGTEAASRNAELQQLRKQVADKPPSKSKLPALTAKELAAEEERIRLECLREMAIGAPTGLSKRVQKRLKREATVEELKAAGLTVPQHRLTAEEKKESAGGDGGRTAGDSEEEVAEDMDEDSPRKDKSPLDRYGISEERLTTLGVAWHKYVWKAGDLAGAYSMPRDLPPLIATESVAKALQGEVSEAIAAKQAAVARLLAATEGLRLAIGEKDDIFIQSKARLKLEDDELQRMVKKAQPKKNASAEEVAKATSLRMRLARQDIVTANTERATRLSAGNTKAQDRHKADLKAIDELVQELEERKTLLKERFTQAETAWEGRREQVSRHDTEVLRLLDEKIAAATPAGGHSQQQHGKAADGAEEEEDSDEEENTNYADLLLTAEGTQPEDLPTLVIKDATPEEKTVLEGAWAYFVAIKARPVGSPTPPTTFEQMGLAHVGVAQTLVSKEVWRKVYGAKRLVGPADWVPWHLMELMRVSLEKAKTELSLGPERQKAADERLSAARQAAKNDGYCPW